MKKLLTIAITFSLIFGIFVGVGKEKVSAAPAQDLISVRIAGFSVDGTKWETIGVKQSKAETPVTTTDTLYIRVLFTGYPLTYLAYSNDVNLSHKKVINYQTTPVVDSNKIVTGFVYYFKVESRDLPSISITIKGINQLGQIVNGNTVSFDRE